MFNNEAACNFPDHEQPLLSWALNATVTYKEAMLLMTMTCRVFMGKKTQDGDNNLTNIVIEAFN